MHDKVVFVLSVKMSDIKCIGSRFRVLCYVSNALVSRLLTFICIL